MQAFAAYLTELGLSPLPGSWLFRRLRQSHPELKPYRMRRADLPGGRLQMLGGIELLELVRPSAG